jgi:glycosyltransferase involved in cell wall biosynthesis
MKNQLIKGSIRQEFDMPKAQEMTVIIPAYNEAQIIAKVLTELQDQLTEHSIVSEIIVVDDGSSDDTAKIAAEKGVRVLRHHSNRGYGAALKTGIMSASHEIVAITDADGTYPSRFLPEMLHLIEDVDMVVGSRTGTNVHIPFVRKLPKWLLNRFANYVTGTKIPDLNSGLRVFRRSIVLQYLHMLPDQFSFTTTITMAMLCDRYAARYTQIDYRQRTGKSKIVPLDAGVFAVLILRMAVLFRPLRVFLPLTGICLSYGVVKMVIDLAVLDDPNISASAILMFLSALLTLLIGMVADGIAVRMGRSYAGATFRTEASEITIAKPPHDSNVADETGFTEVAKK